MTGKLKQFDRDGLRERYGSFYARRTKTPLDLARVPKVLQPIVPYAEIWGLRDDYEREELINEAPQEAKEDLRAIIDTMNEHFDAWLAGPEADQPPFSEEYVAFSNLRIAYDSLPEEE